MMMICVCVCKSVNECMLTFVLQKYEIVKRKRELFGMQTNNRIFCFVLFSVQISAHVRVLNYKQILVAAVSLKKEN